MLVLTRKPGQWIAIGDDITVYVREINGNQVKLGIEAPDDVIILRNEIIGKSDNDNY